LYRHAKLVKTNAVHVEPNGLFVKSEFISGVDNKGRTPAVALHMEASIVSNESSDICYAFEVKNPSGLEIASTKSTRLTFPVERKWSSSVIVEKRVEVQQPMLWSSAEPSLYQITIILAKCHEDSKELDRVSTRHGIRKIYFDADHGFFLNDEKFKIRGFCDHDTFAVVGMALPNRINLFRVRTCISKMCGMNNQASWCVLSKYLFLTTFPLSISISI
jgi:beta-galactosidase